MIKGMKTIKFNAWEPYIYAKLQKIREEEQEITKKRFIIYGLNSLITNFMPTVIGLVSFWLYSIYYEPLTNSKIFSILAMFNSIANPIKYLMSAYSYEVRVKVTNERLGQLRGLQSSSKKENCKKLSKGEILIENGNFRWIDESLEKRFNLESDTNAAEQAKVAELKIPKLKIESGQFVSVIGKVGSGKSFLLNALIDELVRVSGTSSKHGKMALIPQEAFLIHSTIQENITFGLEYDEEKYFQTIRICEMEEDLKILKEGDQTIIGERGVALSGGQKQRISIARAVYSEADIYIIDDALSALDAHVGENIMNNVFLTKLRGKTRIMVTHKLQTLRFVDRVIIMEDMKIVQDGSYSKIKQSESFSKINVQDPDADEMLDILEDIDDLTRFGSLEKIRRVEKLEGGLKELKLRAIGSTSEGFESFGMFSSKSKVKEKFTSVNLIEDKEGTPKLIPSVKVTQINPQQKFKGVYKEKSNLQENMTQYLINELFGLKNVLLTVSIYLIYILWKMVVNKWLTQWSKNSLNFQNQVWYPVIYLLLNIIAVVLFMTRIHLFSKTATQGAKIMFKKLISRLLKKPLSYFETTSSGDIIQRCLTDINTMDFSFPYALTFFLNSFFLLVSSYLIMIYMNPINFAIIAVCMSYSWNCLLKYSKISSSLTKMKDNSINPVVSAVNELVSGGRSIRTYEKTEYLKGKLIKKMNCNFASSFHENVFYGWPKSRFEYSFLLLVTVAISLMTYSKIQEVNNFDFLNQSNIDSGSYSMLISSFLKASAISDQVCYYIIRILAYLGCVYRLYKTAECGKLEEEGKLDTLYEEFENQTSPKVEDIETWPTKGKIEIHNLQLRYKPNLPLVLKSVSLKIQPGEKIGIVGRTGSGKSTLLLALTRIVEFERNLDSHILIDGKYLSEMPLKQLRGNIQIIPQDPFLLEDTLRTNLDIWNQFTDAQVIQILEESKFYETLSEASIQKHISNLRASGKEVSELNNAQNLLSYPIRNNPDNLSLGQRQLLCIARSLLSDPKILLMDEATASIDQKTDNLIQSLIRTKLKNTTVLTIAHRLDTIMDYDRIAVMDYGEILEVGSPHELILKGGSFAKLLKESGHN